MGHVPDGEADSSNDLRDQGTGERGQVDYEDRPDARLRVAHIVRAL